MPSKTGKTYASFYRNDLAVNQSSNTGVDATTRVVHDGAGNSTSISLSDDVLSVQPVTDDTTGVMLVKNKSGGNILAVDATNSKVLVGRSQIAANTQEKIFAVYDLSTVAGTHYFMSSQPGLSSFGATNAWVSPTSGTGAHPATSQTIGTAQEYILPAYWRVSSNITIDEVSVMAGCDASSTLNFHLMSFSVVTGTGSTAGDLSSGVYNATSGTTDPSSLSPITVADDRISIATLTIENADVDDGAIIIAHVENVGGTDDVTAQLILKYHIR